MGKTIPIKINTFNTFNNIISEIDSYLKNITDLRRESGVDEEDLMDDIPMSTTDIQLQIIMGYLNKIGQRAIKLKDKELIENLMNMGVIHEGEPKPLETSN